MNPYLRLYLTLAAAAALITGSTLAQGTYDRDHRRYEEVRERTLPADRETIVVDGRQNGGVHVTGWDRNEILVRARLQVHRLEEAAARELARQITIEHGEVFRAAGPDANWSVSFEIFAPRQSNLRLTARNGGIHIDSVTGRMRFETVNGGIHLERIGGDVTGRTTNGGLHVRLDGEHWEGEKLDVTTTNGGVHLRLPEEYSARLETGTVHGGVNIDFPVTVQGRLAREISTVLGRGGPTIRLKTVNGGLDIRRG